MPKHITESVASSVTATMTFTTGTCAVSPGGVFKADAITEYTTGSGVTLTNPKPHFLGMRRSRFTYNGGTVALTVKVGAGFYYVKDKVATWILELTTAAIGTPVVVVRHYLYLDYSAITSWTAITASELIWSTTAPTYSHTYRGWYNGDDLCIFGVLATADWANIREFFHDGGDFVHFADEIATFSNQTPSDTWAAYSQATAIPAFATDAQVRYYTHYEGETASLAWRTTGQTGASGRTVNWVEAGATVGSAVVRTHTDAAQSIDCKFSAATDNALSTSVHGWYFPVGM